MRQIPIDTGATRPELTSLSVFGGGDLGRVVRRAVFRVFAALDVARERRQLASLDDHLLKDIGLSRSMAACEAERSAFDLPANRPSLGI